METQLIKIGTAQAEDIRKIAQILEQGGLAAIPTETVYGLAARVRPDTLTKLDKIKERQQGKRYTLHIGDKSDLDRYVPDIPSPARKLTKNGWPGPITIVFQLDQSARTKQEENLNKETFDILYSDGTIGIRCPDLPLCSQILRATMAPLVAPSANPGSLPPAVSAQQALDYFGGKIDIVVDGGPEACRYKKSSTVVKVGANGIEILREGVYNQKEVLEMATVRILFVCTGNTCRSPMAQALCKKNLAHKFGCSIDDLPRFGYKVESAGVAAIEGLPASMDAEVVCRQYGISIAGHRSQPLTSQLISDSDFVFVMSPSHLQTCLVNPGRTDGHIGLLDEKNEVPDPIGRGPEIYRKCAEQMESAIKERIEKIL